MAIGALEQDSQPTYKVNIEPSRNHSWSTQDISIAYSQCVRVALLIHHAKRMFRIVLYCIVLYCIVTVACPAHVIFTHNFINARFFGKSC